MLSTYPQQMGLISHGTFQSWAPRFLPSYPGTVLWKVQGTFLAILVAFWGPIWLPKLPSIFTSNFENFRAFFQQNLVH